MKKQKKKRLSDKLVLHAIKLSEPKSENELFQNLKNNYPHIDKSNILRRIRRLRKNNKIDLNKEGKFFIKPNSIQKEYRSDKPDNPQNDFFTICDKYNFKQNFNKKQQQEADLIKQNPFPSPGNRKDFRKDLVITIDGADAKDLDDAVSLKKSFGSYILTVHIADVSYYLKEDSHLDREALKRGNSVYLIDRVIPMLPEALSNGVCSLNANEDRLSLSVIIKFDKHGKVLKYQFHEGIIRVTKRYTYEKVEEILQKNITKEDKPFVKMLKLMNELAGILYKKRIKEGSIDFNFDDIKYVLDEKSFPIKVVKIKRLASHQIIEEFMLNSNKVVARFLGDKGKAIYRIHETPALDKIKEFNRFIQKFGYRLKDPSKPDPSQFQELLAKVANTEQEKLLNTILLRTMKQAYYHTENKGHFALSFKDYTHFTSPIRRYSDLVIHRLLKKALNIPSECKLINSEKYLETVTQSTSIKERIAMEAEREICKKKSARFMKGKVGEVFDGIVSGVTNFGFFVELQPYGIEGLVRVADLKGYFIFDEENYRLYRKDRKVMFQLGSSVKAILAKVDVKRNFIDLVLTDY